MSRNRRLSLPPWAADSIGIALTGTEMGRSKALLLRSPEFKIESLSNVIRVSAKVLSAATRRPQALTISTAVYGPLLTNELDALEKALDNPARPLVAIVGGSKVSTKLTVLENLLGKVDKLVVGGGIANAFLAAAGKPIGKSLCEADMVVIAKGLLQRSQESGAEIPLPVDVVVAKEFAASAEADVKPVDEVAADDMILDVGPDTAEQFAGAMTGAGTIVWNGPVGVFEFDQFGEGTRTLANAVAGSPAFSIAGGGDTIAAIDKYGIREDISYISTAGGAFLEFLEGKKLPAVAVLESRADSPAVA